MNDEELDSLLKQWAEEDVDMPADVHDKTMFRIRQEARRQKKKRFIYIATIAAAFVLCVPLALEQIDNPYAETEANTPLLAMALEEEQSVADGVDSIEKITNESVRSMRTRTEEAVVEEAFAKEVTGESEAIATYNMNENYLNETMLSEDVASTEEICSNRLICLEDEVATLVADIEQHQADTTVTNDMYACWQMKAEELLQQVEVYQQELNEEDEDIALRLAVIMDDLQAQLAWLSAWTQE